MHTQKAQTQHVPCDYILDNKKKTFDNAIKKKKKRYYNLIVSGQHSDINNFRCNYDNSINSHMPVPPPEHIKVSSGWAQ